MNLSEFSLDELVDPFLERFNREFVAKQTFLARMVLEPAVEALIAIKLDPLAADLAQKAVAHIRAIIADWLKGGAKEPLANFAEARLMPHEQCAMVAAGLNPFAIFSAMQLAFTLIEKLLPYFKPVVAMAEGVDAPIRYVIAIDDDAALEAALAA